MWGNAWGQFVWGGSIVAVPAMGTFSLILLGLCLGLVACSRVGRAHLNRHRWQITGAVLVLFALLPLAARALGPIPFVFTNGTTADANQVNANFSFLRNGIVALENQLQTATTRTRRLAVPAAAFHPAIGGG